MDLQKLVDTMNESTARERGRYHLSYGKLIEVLEAAPAGAVVDERIKGIGSWRGSYIEIAIFTEEGGFEAYDGEFDGDYKEYAEWRKEHVISAPSLPTNANELGALLRLLIGKDFIGYKGGNFKIAEYKPLWLCEDSSFSGDTAIVGIDENLKLITKEVD